VAVAEALVDARKSKVLQLDDGWQTRMLVMKSRLLVSPTLPKAARNAASPDIDVVTAVAKNFGTETASAIVGDAAGEPSEGHCPDASFFTLSKRKGLPHLSGSRPRD
jgi:hypothetical protein